MDAQYRARRSLGNAVLSLRQLEVDFQRAGYYDWFNVARKQRQALEFIQQKVELERSRYLHSMRTQLTLAPAPEPGDDGGDDSERNGRSDV